MKRRVVFIADSLDNAYKFQQVLSTFQVEIAAGSVVQVPKLLSSQETYDLIIYEARPYPAWTASYHLPMTVHALCC